MLGLEPAKPACQVRIGLAAELAQESFLRRRSDDYLNFNFKRGHGGQTFYVVPPLVLPHDPPWRVKRGRLAL